MLESVLIVLARNKSPSNAYTKSVIGFGIFILALLQKVSTPTLTLITLFRLAPPVILQE